MDNLENPSIMTDTSRLDLHIELDEQAATERALLKEKKIK